MAKTFKGYAPSEAVTFELESPDGVEPKQSITVRCKMVPGSTFLSFMSKAESIENFGAMATAVREILDAAIHDDDQAMFWAFCDDPANGITVDTLSEIAGYVAESFAGTERPTEPRPA